MAESVRCPLCSETFSSSKIEGHASTCGMPKPPASVRSTPPSSKFFHNKDSKKRSGDVGNSSFSNKKLKNDPKPTKEDESVVMEEIVSKAKEKPLSRGRVPLADTLRPKDFSTYIGQEDAVGLGTQLRTVLDTDCIPSIILWGPPGCGKTSLANVIANQVRGKSRFVKMSACTSGVAEVREVIKQAKNELAMMKRSTILFMDEVHRFNKAQQDSFLPHIESGVITFIGATTENPSFSLNAALLSRCRVVVLEKLSSESLSAILERALNDNQITITENDTKAGSISAEALNYLTNIVDGDARSAINTLQIIIESRNNKAHIDLDQVKEAARRSHVLYDRTGDQHYFMASALQKSIRGSDDNAALYWLGRMLKGGEDPTFIARRLVRCASEDIGLGDPTAMPLAVAAFQGCQLIGKPECDVLLAQATVHLARAKKSHEVYKALGAVYQTIEKGSLPAVPLHLRNASSKLTQQLGWGQGYSHNLDKVQNIQYMPDELKNVNFFK